MSSFGTPDAQFSRRDNKRSAICIQSQPRFFRFLFEGEGDHIRHRSLFAVMRPDEALPGLRAECGKRFPIPRRGPNRMIQLLPEGSQIWRDRTIGR